MADPAHAANPGVIGPGPDGGVQNARHAMPDGYLVSLGPNGALDDGDVVPGAPIYPVFCMNIMVYTSEKTQKFIMPTRELCLSVDQNADQKSPLYLCDDSGKHLKNPFQIIFQG